MAAPGNSIMLGTMILVVEDNDALRSSLKGVLEAEGFDVVTVPHGKAALERMNSFLPDLILSDISMPEMDGYALFEMVRARAEWISIPFIFLTDRNDREEIFASKSLGVEDYLVKPVTRQELMTSIRSRLARNQQLLFTQLQQAYDSSLLLLANAIELRDKSTRGHVERVRDYALFIGRELGWDNGQLKELTYGSILHDIGKIHIQEHVLNKQGQLTGDEWADMRKHTIIGVEMVKDIPYLQPAIPIIHYHHERWDGKGYPQGLKGVDIPLGARIVAVVDSLDAMTTSRSYRKALSPEEAYIEILNCSGTHFDPEVIESFRGAWRQIRDRMG